MWNEHKVELPPYPHSMPEHTVMGIYALELRTNKALTVATGPGLGFYPSISGSIAVWQQVSTTCQNCPVDIMGKDLSTGATFNIASLTWLLHPPVVSGKFVAWSASDAPGYYVAIKDLQTGTITKLGSVQPSPLSGMAGVALSEQYLVWTESTFNAGTTYHSVYAYSFKTLRRYTVLETSERLGIPPHYALTGRYLVWAAPTLNVTDLDAGQTVFSSEQQPVSIATRGDTILWVANKYPGAYYDNVLWGIKLSQHKPVPLVTTGVEHPWPVIAGDWLVRSQRWQGKGRYVIEPIHLLFANPQTIPTVTPTGTPTRTPTRPPTLPPAVRTAPRPVSTGAPRPTP